MDHSNTWREHALSSHGVADETLLDAIENRGRHPSTLCAFPSIKANATVVLYSKLEMMQALRAEYDPRITSISYQRQARTWNLDGEDVTVHFDADYRTTTGREMVEVKYKAETGPDYEGRAKRQLEAQKLISQSLDAKHLIITEESFVGCEDLLANASFLLRIENQAAMHSTSHQQRQLLARLREFDAFQLKDVLTPDCDKGLMLAAFAKLYRRGRIYFDFSKLLTMSTRLSRPTDVTAEAVAQWTASDEPPRDAYVGATPGPDASDPTLSIRKCIPFEMRDLSTWPCPPRAAIPEADLAEFCNRRTAAEMYARGVSPSEIWTVTKMKPDAVRKLVNRCCAADPDGHNHGFFACLPGYRLFAYTRSAESVESVKTRKKGGNAGMFSALLAKFPGLEELIQSSIFKTRKDKEARISYRDLQDDVEKFLRDEGVGDDEYPFNTVSRGIRSLQKYCENLINVDSSAWLKARSGVAAARRSRIGRGFHKVFPVVRPFQVGELDYIKIDSESIIHITTPSGSVISVNVMRWWVAVLIEQKSRAILAAYIALEVNPSSETTLELLEASLKPGPKDESLVRFTVTSDGLAFPNQIIPDLAYQGLDIIRMDNAWANASEAVIKGIIRSSGSIVEFGEVYAWWHRPIVERIQEEITSRGVQRLESTTGSNPLDTTKDKPEEKAVALDITIADLTALVTSTVRYLNERGTQSLHGIKPMSQLKRYFTEPQLGFIPSPMPKAAQDDTRLLWKAHGVTVRGSRKLGRAPHINCNKCRYTGETLGIAWNLLNKPGTLFVRRSDIRDAVFVPDDEVGEYKLLAETRWNQLRCSLRDMLLINRHGAQIQANDRPVSPTRQYIQQKAAEIEADHKAKRKSRLAALEAARMALNAKKGGPEVPPTSSSPASPTQPSPTCRSKFVPNRPMKTL